MYYSDIFNELSAGLLIMFWIVSLVLLIATYICSSLVFFNTAKNNGLNNIAILGWIPIIKNYLLFALGSKKTSPEAIKKDAIFWFFAFIGLNILGIILNFIFLGFIALIPATIIYYYFIYRILYRWSVDTPITVLVIIFSIITSGFVFFIYGLTKMKKSFVAQ